MKNSTVIEVNTISEFHKYRNLQPPEHPLISLIDYRLIKHSPEHSRINWLQKFYSIGVKRNISGKYRYGQKSYDFDNGVMNFFAPNQILNVEYVEDKGAEKPSGWILLIHPDFLWGTALAEKMKHYEFFNYALNESLFLSDNEEATILDILKQIEKEYQDKIDDFSQNIIIAQIELLLNFAVRFYNRQFITRKKSNHEILERLEILLNNYFSAENPVNTGLPTVQYVSENLNLSPGYLSSLTKKITGQSTQDLIHHKLIEVAKEKLTTSSLSVGEIAFSLGFEHIQSFSKLFKAKTGYPPVKYRESFN